MNPLYKKFLISNLIAALIIAVTGTVLYMTILTEYFHWLLPIIFIISLTINLIIFKVILGKNNSRPNILQTVTKSFIIKFFSYTGLAVLIILSKGPKPAMTSSLFFLFSLYIIFTFLEVKAFSEYARTAGK